MHHTNRALLLPIPTPTTNCRITNLSVMASTARIWGVCILAGLGDFIIGGCLTCLADKIYCDKFKDSPFSLISRHVPRNTWLSRHLWTIFFTVTTILWPIYVIVVFFLICQKAPLQSRSLPALTVSSGHEYPRGEAQGHPECTCGAASSNRREQTPTPRCEPVDIAIDMPEDPPPKYEP